MTEARKVFEALLIMNGPSARYPASQKSGLSEDAVRRVLRQYAPLARLALRVNELLIGLMPGLFSYQIHLVATPTPTVGARLDRTINESTKRVDVVAASGAVPAR